MNECEHVIVADVCCTIKRPTTMCLATTTTTTTKKALPPRNWQASDPVKGPDKYHLSAGLPLNVYTHVKLERDKIVGKQIMTVRENSSSTLWNWNLR